MCNIDEIDSLMDNITNNISKLKQLTLLYRVQDIVNNQIKEAKDSKYLNKPKANLKIKEIYKIGGMGAVLVLETISSGFVRCNFSYKIFNDTSYKVDIEDNRDVIITIKSFENNFCPSEFEHPNNNIIANVNLSGCSLSDLQANMILETV